MTGNIICILIAIVVYLVGMVAIGVYYSKGQSDAHEFYLGGRKLGPIVTALSTEASDMSAYLLMGVPGLAFFCGIAEASWTAIGLALGTYLNWLFVAKRLRRYSVRLGALTLPEYISRRFYDNTKLIELIGAITIIVFYVPYTASGFSACGKLFGTLFGYDYVPTMIISSCRNRSIHHMRRLHGGLGNEPCSKPYHGLCSGGCPHLRHQLSRRLGKCHCKCQGHPRLPQHDRYHQQSRPPRPASSALSR